MENETNEKKYPKYIVKQNLAHNGKDYKIGDAFLSSYKEINRRLLETGVIEDNGDTLSIEKARLLIAECDRVIKREEL